MNKIFRIIWSRAKEKWVVVAEKVAAKSCRPSATVGALTVATLLATGGAAFALAPGTLPTGGQISSGSGSIATSGSRMTVNQTSQQMIANWNSFNIGANAGVQFIQPNAQATALNRINDQNPTQILGSLTANGRIFLLNPAGIVFGQSARVDVGGLVASSLNMLDSDFLAGRYQFANSGSAGSIINQGGITAMPGGVVALIAPKVTNDGTITTPSGSTLLAAANQVSLDFKGDGLISYTIEQGAVDALVENKGLIKADGGVVVMTAKAANSLTSAVVNNNGVIEATGISTKGGRILLDGDTTVNTGTLSVYGSSGGSANLAGSYILNSGMINAQGSIETGGDILFTGDRIIQTSMASLNAAGQAQGGRISLLGGAGEYNGIFSSASLIASGDRGGDITLTGDRISLRGSVLDASGVQKGGSIRVGGDLHGNTFIDPITGLTLTNASVTDIASSNTMDASSLLGDAGKIIIWSDRLTYYYGDASAKALGAGVGGFIEVSGKDRLQYGGKVDASSNAGNAGTVLFDPKDITIDNVSSGIIYTAFVNPNPGADTQFGGFLTTLPNGNIVVADPYATAGGQTHAGAAYLFNAAGTLISTITGSHANDQVGYDLNNWIGGTTVLANGNYVISSPAWNGAMGAVTWGSGTTGVSGVVSSANSLVGSTAGDKVGSMGATGAYALSNGNYVVASPGWSNGATAGVGAVTWVNGTDGKTINDNNTISAANSLIGSAANDNVGSQGVAVLTGNGNYVVASPFWDNGGVSNAGAATWGSGTTGVVGTISSANSLVGDFLDDQIGIGRITSLTNGNYVVSSFYWHDGADLQVGAATWVNGATGATKNSINTVSAANSLVGSTLYDNISINGITALSNGNYVVASSGWTNGAFNSAGAATWGDGAAGTVGVVSTANSLVGGSAGDYIGNGNNVGILALSNGNYVVLSPLWDNGATANVGAATWQDGSTAGSRLAGAVISSANSLIGSAANDKVGSSATALTGNGNYVVVSEQWTSGTGAVTWVNGLTGQTSNSTNTISSANSLVGSNSGTWNNTYNGYYNGDRVGYGGACNVTALANGNYVIGSVSWNSAAGAATWGDGSTAAKGVKGVVSSSNSLVGTTTGTYDGSTSFTGGDKVGGSITALTNGNYVVNSYDWSNGGTSKVGAVTWANGTTGITGTVSTSNSLVGSIANDRVGNGGVTALSNGNYVVGSTEWDNGADVDAGAVTWADGTAGIKGTISSTNSLIGSAGQKIGYYSIAGTGDNFGVMNGVDNGGVGIYTVSNSSSYSGGFTFSDNASQSVTITPTQLTDILNTGSNVVLQASNDITLATALTANNAGGNGGALTLQAGRSVLLNGSITTDNGNLTVVANETASAGVVNAQRDAGAAVITMAGGTSINAGTSAVSVTLKNGFGKTNSTSGDITLKDITAGSLAVTNSGLTAGSDIIADGAVVVPGAITFTTPNAFTQNAGATIAGGAGDITITTDTIALNGAANSISGTGTVTLKPQTASRPVVIGASGTASDFALDATELATLKDGFSLIGLGSPSGTGLATVSGVLSFNDRVAIQSGGVGGSIMLNGDAVITSNGNELGFFAGTGNSGTITQASGATITAGGGSLNLVGDNVVLNGATNSIQGVSTLYLQSGNTARPIVIGSDTQTIAGSLALTTTELDTFKNGCNLLNIGQSAFNFLSNSNSGGITVPNPVTFYHSTGLYGQGAGATIAINANTAVEGGGLYFWLGGPILLNANIRGSAGVSFQNNIMVNADNLTVDAGTGNANFNAGGYTVNHGAHDFTITADSVSLNGNWIGTGARTLQPTTVTRSIGLAGGIGSFDLDATELGYLSNDAPASVTIGRVNGTGAISGGAFSFNDPLNLRGGAITQSGDWTLGSTLSLKANFANGAFKNITLDRAGNDFGGAVSIVSGNTVNLQDVNALTLGTSTVSGNLILQSGGALTQTGKLLVTGTTSITAGANDVALNNPLNDFDGAVTVVSGKNVTLVDANAMTLAAVTSSGLVDIATKTGDLTLTGAITTSDATVNAIKLNAGSDAAAGTSTGGNIIVSGGTVSPGAGGTATLYSGSVAGSTGLTELLVSGSGRFRYNSDETAHNYIDPLLAGSNAVYREQPMLTITPDNQTITYGDAIPYRDFIPLTFTLNAAYVNGDGSAGLISGTSTSAWTFSGASSTGGKPVVGTHNVSYNNGLVSSLGYGFTDNGTSNVLTVNKKDLNVNGLTAVNKTYDGTISATLGGTAAVTPVAGDIVNIGGTASGVFVDKNAGVTKAVTVSGNTISGADADNYNLIQQAGLAADISRANLSVTASNASKIYGQTPTLTSFTSSGLQNGETIGGVTLASAGTAATAGVAGSPYAITVSDATGGTFSAGNYTITYNNGSLTVTPAALSVTASDASKIYGQTPSLTSFTSSGLQNGETIGSVSLTSTGTAATAGVAGGPYAITASNATGGTFASGNYTITYNNGSLTVTPASLTVTASDTSKSYGQTPVLASFTSSGLQNGETIGGVTLASAGTAATAGVAGSPYAITASNATGGTFASGNYTITYNNGSLTVTPAALTVTASDASKSYGQTPALASFVSSGLQNGETIGSVNLTSAGAAATAGVAGSPYVITASNATGGTFASGNYTITYNNGSLTVTPAALTVTASDASKSYGQTPVLTAYTSSGLQNGETIGSVSLTSTGTAATAGVAGGPYSITASNATGGTFASGNYTITYNNGNLTVTPAALAITASDATKNYGQTPVLASFVSNGLQNGETIGGVTLSSAGTAATAGVAGNPYAIIASDATGGTFSAENYTITYKNGSLTVISAQTTPVQPPLVNDTTAVTTVTPPPAAINLAPPVLTIGSGGTLSTDGITANSGGSTDRSTPRGNAGAGNAAIVAPSAGITIELISQASPKSTGVIMVAVPKALARPGSSFSFPLPEQVSSAAEKGGEVKVLLANGDPLPAWLRYMHETRTFVASDVPVGSMPITAMVTVGGRGWTVEIAGVEKL